MLGRVSSVFFNLTASNTNDTLDKLEADLAPKLAAHSDSIYLNPRLYARVQALYNTRRLLGLDAQAERLLERYHTHFIRAGAAPGEAQKQQIRQYRSEEHTSELQSLMRISYAVLCLNKHKSVETTKH